MNYLKMYVFNVGAFSGMITDSLPVAGGMLDVWSAVRVAWLPASSTRPHVFVSWRRSGFAPEGGERLRG